MPRSNFLDRFRPVGSPGPAARTGVPAADVQGPQAELAPVFAALAPDLERCRALVDEARRDGEHELATARAAAEAVVAQAKLETESVRRLAYDGVLAASARDDTRLAQDATAEAEQITRRGKERLPDAVRRIVESLFAEAVEE